MNFAQAAILKNAVKESKSWTHFLASILPAGSRSVTGAARGLGHAIALALANAGADVAVGLRDIKADGDLPHKITGLRRRALPLQMDLTKQDQISRAVDDTVKHFGRLDILVNNAGIAPGNLAEDVTELTTI